jgi:peptide deformylase
MQRAILQLGNPELWSLSRPVDDLAGVRQLADDLRDTLTAFREHSGFGRGIAAPQIGDSRRVIFVRMPDGFSDVLVNPTVLEESRERFQLWDDCFSFPDLMVRVERALRVRVAYQDLYTGATRTVDAEGPLSELLQHEIDHLDGILAVDRAISREALCTRTEWEARYR